MYKLKPFVWEKEVKYDSVSYTCNTSFVTYVCAKTKDEYGNYGKYSWYYHVNDYYDERYSNEEFTLKEAKEQCWNHYKERLKKDFVKCDDCIDKEGEKYELG